MVYVEGGHHQQKYRVMVAWDGAKYNAHHDTGRAYGIIDN